MPVYETKTGAGKVKLVSPLSLRALAKLFVLTLFVSSVFVLAGPDLARADDQKAATEAGSATEKSDGLSNSLFDALFGVEEKATSSTEAASEAAKSAAGEAAKTAVGEAAKTAVGEAAKTAVGEAAKTAVTEAAKSAVGEAAKDSAQAPSEEQNQAAAEVNKLASPDDSTETASAPAAPCADTPSSKSPFRVNKTVALDPNCAQTETDLAQTGQPEDKPVVAETDQPEEKPAVAETDQTGQPEEKPVVAKVDQTEGTTVVVSVNLTNKPESATPSLPSKEELQALLRANPPTESARLEEVLAVLENNPGSEDDVFMVVRYLSRRDPKYRVRLGAFFDPTDARNKGTVQPNVKYAYDEYLASGLTEGQERVNNLREWSKTDAAKGTEGLKEFIAAAN
ncbi:MAG: hypothetical protein LBE80_05955 [Deltaproteobacteria bacterium]|jgi:hypothetical protein|nr:hypothetical protein [Deltaproteobacteria bacterium]